MNKRFACRALAALGLCAGLSACLKVDPFIDIGISPAWQPLERADLLGEADKAAIDQAVAEESFFDACVALHGTQLIYDNGDIHTPYNCASVRKSIFSALYGIAEEKGIVNLDASLASLGIDDAENPLSDTEKSATIRQLLQARSGIYIPALGESASMKQRRPARGQYLPGEHFYYNNWDFNALPIILERLSGQSLGELIYEWLAVPTGMRDFLPSNVTYEYGEGTEYPQTRVYISAEDLARLGGLYLNGGQWNGQQVIPAAWVESSVQAVSRQPQDADLLENPVMEGYAYLWWVDDEQQSFWADGAGGHFLIVDKAKNLAVVLRNNTGMSGIGVAVYNSTQRYEDNEKGDAIYQLIKSKLP